MTLPRILVLATGGTIAGQAGDAMRADYRPGQIGIEDYLRQASGLGVAADFTGRQIANIGSEDIDASIWSRLHAEIDHAMRDDGVDGIIHAIAGYHHHGVPAADGEAIVAAVKLSAVVEHDELAALVSDQLASYKRPSRVVVVDEIPRLPSGKVLRRVLKERLWTSV